jgi:hypothetical protein
VTVTELTITEVTIAELTITVVTIALATVTATEIVTVLYAIKILMSICFDGLTIIRPLDG